MTGDVLDVFRRLISKGESRTEAAVRELRQTTNAPRKAKSVVDYDAVVTELDANIAKVVAYSGQGILPAQGDLLDAFFGIFLQKVMTFAQLKIDELFEPDGFREEMEVYIYGQIREAKNTTPPLANIL